MIRPWHTFAGPTRSNSIQSARPMVAGRKERMGKFELGQLLATPGVLAAAGDEDLIPKAPGVPGEVHR